MTYSPKSILVTGGAGFIGSNFLHHILSRDSMVRVVNLDKLTYAGSMSNLESLPDPDRHLFCHGDICDGVLAGRLLRSHRIDTVVHFAAESHVDRSIERPADFIQTNVVGTHTLLEACRQYWLDEQGFDGADCRFHHVSTDEVYGDLGPSEPRFTENSPYRPNSPYSATKAASDHLVRAYGKTYGLPFTISNCTNNYGPRQHTEKFIPTVIRCCERLNPIPVYGYGTNVRDWMHVEDHSTALEHILRHGIPGAAYNIGVSNEWTNIELVKLICRIFDEMVPKHAPHERLIRFVKDRSGHDFRYAIDAAALAAIGWEVPRRDFKSCLSTLIADSLARN